MKKLLYAMVAVMCLPVISFAGGFQFTDNGANGIEDSLVITFIPKGTPVANPTAIDTLTDTLIFVVWGNDGQWLFTKSLLQANAGWDNHVNFRTEHGINFYSFSIKTSDIDGVGGDNSYGYSFLVTHDDTLQSTTTGNFHIVSSGIGNKFTNMSTFDKTTDGVIVGSIVSNAITSDAIAVGALQSDAYDAGALVTLGTAVWDHVKITDSLELVQVLRDAFFLIDTFLTINGTQHLFDSAFAGAWWMPTNYGKVSDIAKASTDTLLTKIVSDTLAGTMLSAIVRFSDPAQFAGTADMITAILTDDSLALYRNYSRFIAEYLGAPCDTSFQLLYKANAFGTKPKDSAQIYCIHTGIAGPDTTLQKTTIWYYDTGGTIIDSVVSYKRANEAR